MKTKKRIEITYKHFKITLKHILNQMNENPRLTKNSEKVL